METEMETSVEAVGTPFIHQILPLQAATLLFSINSTVIMFSSCTMRKMRQL